MSIYIADYDPKWPGMFEAKAQRSVLRSGDWLFASTTLDPPRSRARGEAGDRRTDRCCGSAARRVIWSAAQVTRLHVHDCAGFLFPPTCRVAPTRIRYTCAWPEALTNRVQSRFVISFAVTQRIDGLTKHSSKHWRTTWMLRRPWKAVSAIRRQRRTSFRKSSDAPDLQKRGGLSYNRNRFGFG